MRSLYLRGETWWCVIQRPGGRSYRKSTGETDRTKALAVYADEQRRAGDPRHAPKGKTRLGDAIKNYFDELRRRNRSAATLSIAKTKCGHIARVWGVDFAIDKISASLVDGFISQRESEGAAACTVSKELVALRGLLLVAARRGEFRRDVRAVMPVHYATKYKPRDRWLTVDEAMSLLNHFEEDRSAHIAFLLGSGARLSESFVAKPTDWDREAGTLRIRGTKTDGSDRTIVVTPFSAPFLDYAWRYAPLWGDKLFRPWGKIQRDIKQACKRAVIEPCSPNDFRRTFATWHHMAGAAPWMIGKLLGHTDSTMAEMVYGKQTTGSLGALLESVPGLYPVSRKNDKKRGPAAQAAIVNRPKIAAPPARIGRATFGLGNPRQVAGKQAYLRRHG